MLTWYQRYGSCSNNKKPIKKFLEENNLEYEVRSLTDVGDYELKKIVEMDWSSNKRDIFNKIYKKNYALNRAIESHNHEEFLNILFENNKGKKRNFVDNFIVDWDSGKTLFHTGLEDLRKFIPREERRKEMEMILKKLEEMDDEKRSNK